MKKNIFLMSLMLVGMVVGLWSCSEDDMTPSSHFSDNVIAFSVGANTTDAAASSTRSEVNTYELQADDAADDVMPIYLTEAIEPMEEIGSESGMLTRGTPIYTENFAQYYTAFQAVAYAPGTGTKTTVTFNDEDCCLAPFEMTKEAGTNWWKHTFEARTKWWPANNGKLAFFYVAPAVAGDEVVPYTNLTYGLNNKSKAAVISFDYTSPSTAVAQKDILFSGKVLTKEAYEAAAKTVNGSRILFYHPLAAVKFKQANITTPAGSNITDLHISKITFTGIKDKGSCTITVPDYGESPESEPDGGANEKSEKAVVWSGMTTVSGTISQSFETTDLTDGDEFDAPDSFRSAKNGSKETNPAASNINDKDYSKTFMVIPQTLGYDAKLTVEISYKKNGTDAKETRTLPLSGTWKAGNMYTYGITLTPSDWDYHLEVEMPMTTFSYIGGIQNLNVQSWKENRSTGEKKKVSWTMMFKENPTDEASTVKPVFIGSKTQTTGEGSIPDVDELEVVPVEFTKAELMEGVIDYEFQTPSSTPIDLSSVNENGVYSGTPLQNTANSYVINAGGTYRIPLVYGNAIRKGKKNEGAYKTSGSMTNFINHADKPITSPYIQDNLDTDDTKIGTKTLTAELVWQDAPSLVTNLTIGNYDDKTYDDVNALSYLEFEVPAASIVQGNALLAVKANGVTVWSWHIWFTPRPVFEDVTVRTFRGAELHFMPITMGEVLKEDQCTYYEPRTYYIEIIQNESGIGRSVMTSQTYELIQTGGEEFFGVAPYYQFGRKDPMPRASFKMAPDLSYFATMYDIDNKTIPYGPTNDMGDYDQTDENDRTFYINNSATGGLSRTIGCAIQHPETYFGVDGSRVGYSWYSGNTTYYNLWSANAAEPVVWTTGANDDDKEKFYPSDFTTDIKTVYDPCPVGFKVPELADINNAFDPLHVSIAFNHDTKSYVAAFGERYITVPSVGHMQTGAHKVDTDADASDDVVGITRAGYPTGTDAFGHVKQIWRGYYATATMGCRQYTTSGWHEYWYISSGVDDDAINVFFKIRDDYGYQDYGNPILPVREKY